MIIRKENAYSGKVESPARKVLLAILVGLSSLFCFAARAGEPFASAMKEHEIIDHFKRLPRPIQCRQREYYNKFGSLYEMSLSGAWKDFCDCYSKEELIYSLWPLLDHSNFDAEAVAVLYAKTKIRYTGGFLSSPFVDGHPANWEKYRFSSIRSCKWDIRREMQLGQDWMPHQLVFPGRTDEELQLIKADISKRAELIQQCKRLLTSQEVVEQNPLELGKIFHALQILDAWELTPELCDLFFYDTRTGRNFRFEIPKDRFSPEFAEYLEWKRHPDSLLPPISTVVVPSVLYWKAFSTRTNAIPSVLSRLSKTTKADRRADVGGGFAEAIVIQYLQNPSLRLTQRKCLDLIDDFLARFPLSADERSIIDHFKETIQAGKYQNTAFAVGHGWFGDLPFDYRIFEDGVVFAGKTVGNRFFTYRFGKGKVGRIEKSRMDAFSPKILRLEKDAGMDDENRYRIEEIGLYDRQEEQRLTGYISYLRQELKISMNTNITARPSFH